MPAATPTENKPAATSAGHLTGASTGAAVAAAADPQRPLMIVATFLIIGGALLALRLHPVNLLIGAGEIALGVGLIKRKPAFRIATLVWLGIVMGVMALNAVVILLTKGAHQHLVPAGGPNASKLMQLFWTVLSFALAAIGYRILKRPAVQALFYRNA